MAKRKPNPKNEIPELRHPGDPLGDDYEVDPFTGCWNWRWGCNGNPNQGPDYQYPSWGVFGKMQRVGRTLLNAPPELLVCHLCNNPRCVNPDHLYLGTYSDNLRDRQERFDREGKVTPKDRYFVTLAMHRQFLDMLAAGYRRIEIAEWMGVRPSTVGNYISGKNGRWRNLV